MRDLLVDGRLGIVALDMMLDEVVRAFGPADDWIPQSRKDRRPALLRYGSAQLFFHPDGRLDAIGIYPLGDVVANQVAVDVEFGAFLRDIYPQDVLEAINSEPWTLVEELDGGKITRERRMISDVHRDADCLRLRLACGSEAIFVRNAPTARWRLEKMFGSCNPRSITMRAPKD